MRLSLLKSAVIAILACTAMSCSGDNDDEQVVTYTITVTADEGGRASSTKSFCAEGEEVTAEATADENYRFVGWYETDECISTEGNYTFVMPARNVVLQARFEESVSVPAEAIDLGLSVKWASWNVGASAPEEFGGLYGWADPTGEKTTVDFNDYPSDTPPTSISNTMYDIAHVRWGDGWRLPTQAEFQELVDNCTWEWTEVNNVAGRRATGPNGNSIFFPAAASRNGGDISNQVGQRGCYWTGTLYPDDSRYAYYFYFYSGNQYANRNNRRYMGYSVRPVKE
ncbi:InlB B-repeat-containing protein [Bacteroides intestinalis]|uniref:InlB B-repeat-containing protein n=1 Tax=Bacteroides intestinalis TaxID=329854 RepID=UPI00189F816C|nr:DUF1566 domain-containing protein [Bacteroides intestinalis]